LRREHKKNVRQSKKVNYVMDDLFSAGTFASRMGWEMEEEVVIFHLKLDVDKIEQDLNTGAFSSWFEYHGDISPSRITKIERADSKFWKAHQRRMQRRFK